MEGQVTSAFGEAVFLSGVAFSVVFLMLMALTAVIFAMKAFSGGKKKPVSTVSALTTAAPQKSPSAGKVSAGQQGVNPQIVAVITAAIAQTLGRPFRIKSVTARRANSLQTGWRAVGRMDGVSSNELHDPWRA